MSSLTNIAIICGWKTEFMHCTILTHLHEQTPHSKHWLRMSDRNSQWTWTDKKTLKNSIGQLLEAFDHIFHDGTCKIKTLITEEKGELARMMIIFNTILLFLGSSLHQYLRPHLNYCTPWFTRWLVNSLAIKLPTFLSRVSLSWWWFPFLATLVLLCPISLLLYFVHAHCLQRGTGGWNIWGIVRFLQVLLLCKVLYEMFLVCST
jgi:hypothetical protein